MSVAFQRLDPTSIEIRVLRYYFSHPLPARHGPSSYSASSILLLIIIVLGAELSDIKLKERCTFLVFDPSSRPVFIFLFVNLGMA